MTKFDKAGLEATKAALTEQGIDVLRVGYADLIGTDRGRDVLVNRMERTLSAGLGFCRSVYVTTPMGDVVDMAGGLRAGLPDIIAFPDLETLQPIPWEPGIAHVIADLYNPDHTLSAESPREVLRQVQKKFCDLGVTPICGPELEFYILVPSDEAPNGWARYGESTGNVYVSGLRGDPENILLRALRHLGEYGIDAISGNHEFASGQFEINLLHSEALDSADRAHRFKAAIKELARADEKLATFMAKPFNDEGGSGFHIHFSCVDDQQNNVFDGGDADYGLSDMARWAIGGILAHAPAVCAFNNPTINSYKRFGPDTLAPWLIDWGLDNRSTMIRIPPERGRSSRLELRLGDASANPYLATASLLAAAYLGIQNKTEPQPPVEGYGYDTTKSAKLPSHLSAALDALEDDAAMIDVLGRPIVEAFLAYKRDEVEKFRSYVTDWEFREYTYHL